MQTLTQLITSLQALFIDDGTNFTTALCTAAIRQALKDFNSCAPIHAGEVIPAVAGQMEYELPDSSALTIVDVLKKGTDLYAEQHVPVPFNAYWEDSRPFFRIHVAEPSGDLIVRYTTPHTISGLDSASKSTLPAFSDGVLLDGACYRAAWSRAAGRIEQINLNPDVAKHWQDMADQYKDTFFNGLLVVQRQQTATLGTDAGITIQSPTWNDQYHIPGS